MTEDSGSYREGVQLKRSGINPTVNFQLGQSDNLQVAYEYFRDQRTTDRGIPSFNGRPLATDAQDFFGNQEISKTMWKCML